MNSNYYIVCGYSGVGKSTAEQKSKNVFDFESSIFSHNWDSDNCRNERNADFPKNYIDAVCEHMENHHIGIYLLSCHKEVREELKRRGLSYIIVMPDRHQKNEYIKRWLKRGSSIEFIQSMSDRWEEMINSCGLDDAPKLYLQQGEYISDVLPM